MENVCSSTPHSENANALDISSRFSLVQDINQIDELIICIQERLRGIEEKTPERIPNTFQTCIKLGGDLLESVLDRFNSKFKICCYKHRLSAATRKVVIDVLKGAGKTPWLGAGASVLGYILDQIDQISSNKSECIKLLKYMCELPKHVRQLNENLPVEKQKLNDVVLFIVEGSLMCLLQMHSHKIYRIFSSSVDAEHLCMIVPSAVDAKDLQSFPAVLADKYQDLSFVAIMGVLDRIPKVIPPSQGGYPDAVNIEEARDKVIRLLKMEVKPSRTAVVVYGAAGVGKTTLATAVYSKLDLTSYKFCRIDMEENCSENHLMVLQQQILQDLFNERRALKCYVDGQTRLAFLFKSVSQPVFMFINNAMKGSDLEKLLPLLRLPKHTKILLTTRRLDETSMLLQPGVIERNEYWVGFLSPKQSKQFLCKTALGNAGRSFPESIDIDGLIEKCGGIPLILNLIGSKLREHVEDVSTCKELVTSFKQSLTGGEGEMCERVVDVVYNSFKEPSQKEAFLDIVFFLNNLPWRIVSYVVGRDNLEALENAGLVQLCREDNLKRDTGVRKKWVELEKFVKDVDYQTGTVKVVDAVRARGRKLLNSDRILDDVNSISKSFECRQKLKGIWLSDKVKCQVESERFSSTMSSSRILHFGHKVKVNGVFRENSENLRYLNGHDLPVDVRNAKKLAFLVGNVPYGFSQLPSSLRLVELRGNPRIPAGLIESVGKLSSLEELNLKFSSRRQLMLPASFSQLQCLRFLELKLNLPTLPDSFGNLTALEGLSLKYCTKLQSLPESFCELKCLRFLRIEEGILTELPEKFGNLSALEEMHLSCCHLVSLPASFGKLESLRILGLYWCTTLVAFPENFGDLFALQELVLLMCPLVSLPNGFGKLKSLRILYLIFCDELIALPEDFGSLSSLEYLKLQRCPELMTLPQSFGQLSHLKELYISGAHNMLRLPDQFGQLSSLERLSLIHFRSLKKLCPDFHCLTSVAALVLAGCPRLEEMTIDLLVQMKNLMTLNITRSPRLINRWQQVKNQHTLIVLQKDTILGCEEDDNCCLVSVAEDKDDEGLREKINTALFHYKSSFLHVDISGKLGESLPSSFLSSQVKLALLLTKCDLSSSSKSEALEIVKEKCAELQSKDFHIMYVQVGELREKNEQLADQTLPLLSPGTYA